MKNIIKNIGALTFFISIMISQTCFGQECYVNDFNISSEFDKNEILSKIGVPDSIIEGGSEIVQEFGYNTYIYKYGLSYIDFKEDAEAITNINVNDSNLSINDIKVGDNIQKIKSVFLNEYIEEENRFVIRYGDYASLSFEYGSNLLITRISYVVFT